MGLSVGRWACLLYGKDTGRQKTDTVLANSIDVGIQLQICSHANRGYSYRHPANEGEEGEVEKS